MQAGDTFTHPLLGNSIQIESPGEPPQFIVYYKCIKCGEMWYEPVEIEVRYVHQLQNFVHALLGKDIEAKWPT